MKKLCSITLLILIALNIFACDDLIKGLNRFNILNESDITLARFGPENKKIYYIKYLNDPLLEYCAKVFIYDINMQKETLFFDPFITADPLKKDDSIGIKSIFVTNDSLLVIVGECQCADPKMVPKFTYKLYVLDINTGYIIKVENIDDSLKRIYHNQSTTNRDLISEKGEDCFFIIDSKENIVKQYDFPDNIVFDFFYTPNMISGRNEDEIIMSYNPSASRHGSNFTQIALKFYSIVKGAFTQEVLLPSAIVEKTIGNPVDILLSPTKDKILLHHSSYGFWVYNIDTGKINTLIEYDYSSCLYRINAMDWSWDGKKLLLNSKDRLYELDVEEFIESNPEGLIMEYE